MSALTTSCLVIMISHGGHCLGGGACRIDLTWAADVEAASAVVTWGLSYAETTVADGRVQLEGRAAPATISLDLPAVRARTEFTWSYRLLRQSDGRLLEEGRRSIQAYPPITVTDLKAKFGSARVLVLEGAPGLSRFLEHAGIVHQVASGFADLEYRGADVVLVGPDRLGNANDAHAALLGAARRGAAVLVLVQLDAPKVTDLEVARHSAAPAGEWRTDHPLLAGLPDELWQSWLAAGEAIIPALVVPPTEPALEIAYWPPRAEGRMPGPLDATLLERRLERGRMVLCQIPASADVDDPRTQIFLVNALAYLRTAPQPTPARAERLATSKPAGKSNTRPENILGVEND